MAAEVYKPVWGIVHKPNQSNTYIINAHGTCLDRFFNIPSGVMVHFTNREGTACIPVEKKIDEVHNAICK